VLEIESKGTAVCSEHAVVVTSQVENSQEVTGSKVRDGRDET